MHWFISIVSDGTKSTSSYIVLISTDTVTNIIPEDNAIHVCKIMSITMYLHETTLCVSSLARLDLTQLDYNSCDN